MKTNKNQWQDDAALKRYTMIAPLLDSSIDNARRVALRKKIAEDNNTTIRSLYRYEKAYRKDGFAGLRPSNREKQRSQALPDNFQEPAQRSSTTPQGSSRTLGGSDHPYS